MKQKQEISKNEMKRSKNIKLFTNIALIIFMIVAIVFAVNKEVKSRVAEKLKKEQAASVVLTPAVNPNNPIQKPIVEKAKVIAYYLHATGRCSNCIKIEAWSKAALDKFFVKEQKNGKLQFIVLNIDEGENRHFVEDYKLVTKSLVLSLVKNGKEINYEVLSGVWNYLNDENAFYQYVKGRTDEFLKASE